MMDPRFKSFLLKRLLKDARYNPNSRRFDVPEITLNRQDKVSLFLEGRLYGYDPSKVSEFIQEVLDKGIKFSSSLSQTRSILPGKIKIEQHLRIDHVTDNRKNTEDLLKIGKEKYLLINHDRGALMPGTILKTKTSPWQIGSFVEFVVVPKTEKAPSRQTIYKTGEIISISMITPSELYQFLEPDENGLSRKIFAAYPNKKEGFGHEVLSLEIAGDTLFEIEQKGNKAYFQPLPSTKGNIDKLLKSFDRVLAPACKMLNEPIATTKSILVKEKGELEFEKDYWRITKKATIKFSDQLK